MDSNSSKKPTNLQKFIAEHTDFECRSYSGRGMFGEQCLGVTCRNESDFMRAMFRAIATNPEKVETFSKELQVIETDSMGMDVIIYFRRAGYDGSGDDLQCEECNDAGCEECQPDCACQIEPDGVDYVRYSK